MIKLSSLLPSCAAKPARRLAPWPPPSLAGPASSQMPPRSLGASPGLSIPSSRSARWHFPASLLRRASARPRVPNFSWLFCFQGAVSPQASETLTLSANMPCSYSCLLGFPFFFTYASKERRRLLYQFYRFCQQFFSIDFGIPNNWKNANKMRKKQPTLRFHIAWVLLFLTIQKKFFVSSYDFIP